MGFQRTIKGYIDATVELRSVGENGDTGTAKRKQEEFKQKLDDIISGKRMENM